MLSTVNYSGVLLEKLVDIAYCTSHEDETYINVYLKLTKTNFIIKASKRITTGEVTGTVNNNGIERKLSPEATNTIIDHVRKHVFDAFSNEALQQLIEREEKC